VEGKVTVGFDGECLMCSRGIRFLAEHDSRHRFQFLKLQSARGQHMQEAAGESELKTMLVEADGRIYARSAAVLRCMKVLGGGWAFLAALGHVTPGRDLLYNWIAKNRHRWFGKGDICAMPSPALRERLVDGDGV
jgi:predicted DCC family thiol-disulfide oxidoreductase YuxK